MSRGEPVYTEVLQQRAGSLNIKRVLLIQVNQISLKNFAHLHGKIQESGLTEMSPSIFILANWGQYPVFLHPEFLHGLSYRVIQSDGC